MLHGFKGVAHQVRAVIVRDHLHAFRQATTIEFFHLGVNVIEHDGGVGSALEQHNALHHVVLIIHAHRALTRCVRLHYTRHITNRHRGLATHGNHHILNLLWSAQQTNAANDEGLLATAHQTTTHVAVGLGKRVAHIIQAQTQAVEFFRVYFHVEFFDEATNTHHISHALHLLEHAHYMPFLLGAKLRQRVFVALQAVVKNLAQRRVVRRHFWRYTIRQIGLWQTLGNLGTRVKAIGIVIKDKVDHGEAEIALRSQCRQPRRAVQLPLQRLRDLALYFFGGKPRCLGNHTHLHIGHIGVGLDGGLQIGVHAIDGDGEGDAQRHQTSMNDE